MTHIHHLPDELLLSIFHLIKQENHLNLIYFANACKRFQRLSMDYTLWKNTIILDHRSILPNSIRPIPFPASYKKLNAKEIFILDSNQSEMEYLKNILIHYNKSTTVDLNIVASNPIHYWNVLTKYNNNILFRTLSISPLDENNNTSTTAPTTTTTTSISAFSDEDTKLFSFLTNIQNHLQSFNFSMLPLQKLIHHHTSLVFPNIHILDIGLLSNIPLDWAKVKLMFPNLNQLTLHSLPSNCTFAFWEIIRSLWSSPDLFPWLESMVIIQENTTDSSTSSFSSPTITKDEVVETLARLNGLVRIDTGCWDIIAVENF
ncbi:hypothetical protein BJ944DRAFT_263198 [Cunninghamella echinulata]|nr:hypothetical protein BJ944DRAFT_263198 [Cunninghamella echinulata]